MKKPHVKFASVVFESIDANKTLPAKFGRMLSGLQLKKIVRGKIVALKMHLGSNIGYTTIHPLFTRILVNKIKEAGGNVFITDIFYPNSDFGVNNAKNRGYSEDILSAPVFPVAGVFDKYFYPKKVDYKTLKEVQVSGHIHDAEVLINFSHAKGHGISSFGDAIKNISMGCVTKKTRQDLHLLHSAGSGIVWDESLCTHCEKCVKECRYRANKFNKDNKYVTSIHDCTYCLHCVEICQARALKFAGKQYMDFQEGMSVAATEVLKTFKPKNILHINMLTNITILCDCWGMSTPSMVPDIGILASDDIVAIDKASLDMIKKENLLPNSLPSHWQLRKGGHLFECIWGKDPYLQLSCMADRRMGSTEYEIEEVL
jgi:uncharacterized Fe-S center protein